MAVLTWRTSVLLVTRSIGLYRRAVGKDKKRALNLVWHAHRQCRKTQVKKSITSLAGHKFLAVGGRQFYHSQSQVSANLQRRTQTDTNVIPSKLCYSLPAEQGCVQKPSHSIHIRINFLTRSTFLVLTPLFEWYITHSVDRARSHTLAALWLNFTMIDSQW